MVHLWQRPRRGKAEARQRRVKQNTCYEGRKNDRADPTEGLNGAFEASPTATVGIIKDRDCQFFYSYVRTHENWRLSLRYFVQASLGRLGVTLTMCPIGGVQHGHPSFETIPVVVG